MVVNRLGKGVWIAVVGALGLLIARYFLIDWSALTLSTKILVYGQQLLVVVAVSILFCVGVYVGRKPVESWWHSGQTETRLIWIVVGACLLYVLMFGWMTFHRHYHFNTAAYDLGIQDQLLWNTSQGRPYASSFEVDNYLADHLKPLVAILTPFYWLSPSPYWLLGFQTVALALGGWPVYRLARRRFDHVGAGVVFACVYLIYPSVGYINRFDFHWEATVIPLMLAAIEAFDRDDLKWTAVWLGLALLGKEEIGLTIAMLGLWFVWRKRAWFGGIWLVAGSVYSLLAVTVIIPAFKGEGQADTLGRYGWLGEDPAGIVQTLLTEPLTWLPRLVNIDAIRYVAALLGPFAFLPALNPLIGAVLPAYGYNLLANSTAQQSVYFQYVAPIVPIVVASAVLATAWLFQRLKPWARVSVLGCIVIFSLWHFLFVHSPIRDDGTVRSAWQTLENAEAVRVGLSGIPPEADVFTTNPYAPHLTHRRAIQIPFRPEDATYLETADMAFFNLRDFRSTGEDWTCVEMATMLDLAVLYEYGVIFEQDGVVVLERGAGSQAELQSLRARLCVE